MCYWFVQIIVGILARILLRIEIEGADNIPRRGAFILASNHLSHLDPPMLAISVPRKLFFLAKMELFNAAFFGPFIKGVDCIRLNREGIDRSALKEALKALHRGRGLAVFPEGTRSKDGRLGYGKAGVAIFAFGSGAPVVPVFIKGTERAMPPQRHFIVPGRIKVIFGRRLMPPAIVNKADKKSAYQGFTDRVMQEIANLEKEAA